MFIRHSSSKGDGSMVNPLLGLIGVGVAGAVIAACREEGRNLIRYYVHQARQRLCPIPEEEVSSRPSDIENQNRQASSITETETKMQVDCLCFKFGRTEKNSDHSKVSIAATNPANIELPNGGLQRAGGASIITLGQTLSSEDSTQEFHQASFDDDENEDNKPIDSPEPPHKTAAATIEPRISRSDISSIAQLALKNKHKKDAINKLREIIHNKALLNALVTKLNEEEEKKAELAKDQDDDNHETKAANDLVYGHLHEVGHRPPPLTTEESQLYFDSFSPSHADAMASIDNANPDLSPIIAATESSGDDMASDESRTPSIAERAVGALLTGAGMVMDAAGILMGVDSSENQEREDDLETPHHTWIHEDHLPAVNLLRAGVIRFIGRNNPTQDYDLTYSDMPGMYESTSGF